MSLINNIVTQATRGLPFINDDPAQTVSRIAGYVSGQTPQTTARGPLASLYNTSKNIANWKYPEDLGTGQHQNWIVFKILESVQTAGGGGSSFGNLGGVTNTVFGGGPAQQGISLITGVLDKTLNAIPGASSALNSIGINNMSVFNTAQKVRSTGKSIALYVPQTIMFNQGNQYTETSLTQQLGLALAAAETAQGIQGGQAFKNLAPFAIEQAAKRVGLSENLALYGITGTVLNPQIEVIFEMTNLRTFQFDFVLAARSRAEIQSIHNIVNQFRHAAAPSFANGGAGRYLIPPSEFDIEFIFSGAPSIMIPKISTCVIESVNVDMAPSGQYSVFEDGRPTSVRLTLQFKEVDLITKERTAMGY